MKQTAWYTHDGNIQKGPYSETELKTLVVQGQVFPKTFIWRTGMSDWTTWEKVGPEIIPPASPEITSEIKPDIKTEIKSETAASSVSLEATTPLTSTSRSKLETSKPRIILAAGLVLVSALLIPKIWGFAQFELKLLEMVQENDRKTVRERLKNKPYSITLTKQQDNFHSLLFVNQLPIGSWVRMKMDGNPETLLNRLSARSELTFQIKSQFEVTPELRLQDGTLIPAGEYQVQIEIEGNPSPIREKHFLGSKADSTYIAKLKEFHGRVQKKAITEVQENELYLGSLENQLQVLIKNPNKMALEKWMGFQTQLKGALSNSAKSPAKEQLYYPELRLSLLELESLVQSIQTLLPATSAALLPAETRARVLMSEIRGKLEDVRAKFPLKESKI